MLRSHITELERLLGQYLAGGSERASFQADFGAAVARYREFIQCRPYYPLVDVGEYGGPDESLQMMCRMASERLPREELDRETRHWIQENLVDHEEFSFFDSAGCSKLGTSLRLYESTIDKESFLLSALNGTLRPFDFGYSNLLTALKTSHGDELAAWVACSEPDNAFAHVDQVWTLESAFEESGRLAWLEQVRGDTVQWGNCYLLLLPKSKGWMLVHHYRFSNLEISLHGTNDLIEKVASHNQPLHPTAFGGG